MKRISFLFVMILTVTLSAQTEYAEKSFSTFKFDVAGGVNLSTGSTIGSTILLGVKTYITNKLFAKASAGFSSTYEGNSYDALTYKTSNIGGDAGYTTYSYSVDQIEYSILMINIGLQYVFTEKKFSPFVTADVGLNKISGEPQVITSGSGMFYENIEEIPAAFKNTPTTVTEGEYLGVGVGFGILYKITSSVDLSIRYIFRYNDSIVNSNNVMFGISF